MTDDRGCRHSFWRKEGIKLCQKVKPDIVLMDINMPDMDGLAATNILTCSIPDLGVIIMSVPV